MNLWTGTAPLPLLSPIWEIRIHRVLESPIWEKGKVSLTQCVCGGWPSPEQLLGWCATLPRLRTYPAIRVWIWYVTHDSCTWKDWSQAAGDINIRWVTETSGSGMVKSNRLYGACPCRV